MKKSAKGIEPEFRCFGVSEEAFQRFSDYTSIRPTPANGPVFAGLLTLSIVAVCLLAIYRFDLSVGAALLAGLLFAFPLSFLLLILFAYCAQVCFLNFHPERESLNRFVEARRNLRKRRNG